MATLAGVSMKNARRLCYLVAALIIIETILIVSMIAIQSGDGSMNVCSSSELESLDHDCIKDLWKVRHKYRWIDFCLDIVGGLSSFLLIPIILALIQAFALKSGQYSGLLGVFVAGAAVEGYEFLIRAGRNTTGDWIFNNFDLEQNNHAPMQALEITYLMLRGEKTWLVAMDQVLLALGIIAVARLTYSHGVLPRWHAHFGTFTGVIGIITFCLELARFGAWRLLSEVSGIFLGVFGFVLIPVWLVVLGCTLGKNESNPDYMEASQAQWVSHRDDDGNTGVELSGVGIERP